MFITIIGVNVFSGNPIIEVTQKINIYGSFSSCEQCFRSGIAIDLSGMRQYRPLSGRTQKDVIAEPTDKWRRRRKKFSGTSDDKKRPVASPVPILNCHLPVHGGKCRDVLRWQPTHSHQADGSCVPTFTFTKCLSEGVHTSPRERE